MIIIKRLSDIDLEKVKIIPTIKLHLWAFLLLGVPASFLFGLFGLANKGLGYWISTMALIMVLAAVTIFNIIKKYFHYYKDRRRLQKYAGEITIIAKSRKNGEKKIVTDSREIKWIELETKDLFDRIAIGDKLYIEISKYSKTLLRLEKNQIDMLTGN